MMKVFKITFLFFVSVILFSCNSTRQEHAEINAPPEDETLSLVFCGDVMAHTQNFRMKDYSQIWEGIKEITQNSDFTFANIESPINDEAPFENYPTFNMQYSYPQAAVDAGINVITVANNHTNDHLETGINATRKWELYITQKYKDTSRPVYVSGLKTDISTVENALKSEVSYCTFSKGNFKILFLGITQLLNTQDYKALINYFPNTIEQNKKLLKTIRLIRENNPCDVFILAMHTDETEYILDVTQKRRDFYLELLDSGVDILWANHPHVVKPVEYIADSESGRIKKAILYATGNTISGQRRKPNFKNPEAMREYTGDGILVSLNLKKENGKVFIKNSKIDYITTFIDSSNNYLIKLMNDDFFTFLEEQGLIQWKEYLIERKKLLKQQKEIITWQ